VHALILAHQRVFHVLSKEDWESEIIRFSLIGSWRELVLLATADNRGRISPNTAETEMTLSLVREAAEEKGCLDASWSFPSRQAMVRFARSRDATPFYDPPPPTGSRVVLLSGMPGAGKNTYAETALGGLPQVSFDAIRARMRVRHGEREGEVAQAAFEEARVHLRAGQDFVWNATSLTRLARDRVIDLALGYDACVEIHALEVPYAVVLERNAQRKGAMLPLKDLLRFVERWDPPLAGEAHELVDIDSSRRFRPGPDAGGVPRP